MPTKPIGKAALKRKPDGRIAVVPKQKPRDASHARAMAKSSRKRVVTPAKAAGVRRES